MQFAFRNQQIDGEGQEEEHPADGRRGGGLAPARTHSRVLARNMTSVAARVETLLQKGQVKIESASLGRHNETRAQPLDQHHKLMLIKVAAANREQQRKREQFAAKMEQQAHEQEQDQARGRAEQVLMEKEERRRRAQIGLQQLEQQREQRRLQQLASEERMREVTCAEPLHKRLDQQRRQVEPTRDEPLKARINYDEIREHDRFFMKMRKEVSESHSNALRQQLENSVPKLEPKSAVAELLARQRREQKQEIERRRAESQQRLKKVEEYKEYVLENHLPRRRQSVPLTVESLHKARSTSISCKEIGVQYLKELREHNVRFPKLQKVPEVETSRPLSEKKDFLSRRKEEDYQRIKDGRLQKMLSQELKDGEVAREVLSRIEQMDESTRRQERLKKAQQGGGLQPEHYISQINRKLMALEKL